MRATGALARPDGDDVALGAEIDRAGGDRWRYEARFTEFIPGQQLEILPQRRDVDAAVLGHAINLPACGNGRRRKAVTSGAQALLVMTPAVPRIVATENSQIVAKVQFVADQDRRLETAAAARHAPRDMRVGARVRPQGDVALGGKAHRVDGGKPSVGAGEKGQVV